MSDNGLREFNRRLARAMADGVIGAIEGVQQAQEHVLGVSNQHIPIEEGVLERDGKVVTSFDNGKVSAAVTYGNGTRALGENVSPAAYVVRQHEDMTLRHDPGRTAKFLENAVSSERDTSLRIIQTTIRRRLGT